MNLDIHLTALGTASSPRSHPYAPSLSSSASTSTSSVFSDVPSYISSATSSASHPAWEPSDEWSSHSRQAVPQVPISCETASCAAVARASTFPLDQPSASNSTCLPPPSDMRSIDHVVPAEQRQHPRRSSTLNQRPPPQLVRQTERKVNFVDSLVDAATQMVEVIWPLSVPTSLNECSLLGRAVLPLRTFIQETLRRSRSSYSTLQVALYYLILIKAHVPKQDFTMEQVSDACSYRALQCGRRMFLAALILASKYLQDRNYSARAWSKISGLKVCEINTNEMAFLAAVNWKLHITDPVWDRWTEVVLRHTPQNHPPTSPGASLPNTWRNVIPLLTPEMDTVKGIPRQPLKFPARLLAPVWQSPKPAQALSDGFGSQESTPSPSCYQAPSRVFSVPFPTPWKHGMATLPTPCLTPQSVVVNTPAAGVSVFESRRPSMCHAMAQVQSSSLARASLDQFTPNNRTGLEAYHFPTRRPSLALSSGSSSSSSPESMVTDRTRSSRASSISSVSSSGFAPNQPKLARLATCRSAGLTLSKCTEEYASDSTDSNSSPDLESFHIDDSSISPEARKEVMIFDPELKTTDMVSFPPSGRKRGRSSVDLQQRASAELQQMVRRNLLCPRGGHEQVVLPDRSVAHESMEYTLPYFKMSYQDQAAGTPRSHASEWTGCIPFPLPIGPKGLQSPKHTVPERQRPFPNDVRSKRVCGSEKVIGWQPGPGMWAGVL